MTSPRVEVTPNVALVDEKICVRAVNLQPSQEVTLQAWVSERGAVYTSCGQFVSDGQGCVDTTQHSSLGGTYTDSVLASTTCERWYKHESVRRIVVREGKLRGTLFLPAGSGPFPGIIDMFGTGVALMEIRAALLASRGFAAFALAYYMYDDLPKTFDFDVRYFIDAVDWFSSHPSVQPGGVGVVGVSKGGELALLLASQSEKVKAVVNISGGPAVTYADIYKDGTCLVKALKYHPNRLRPEEQETRLWKCYDYHKMNFSEAWKHNAKILYLCGDDDGSWDTQTVTKVFYLLVPDDYKKNVEIINYPGAGHLLEPPYMPLCRSSYLELLGVNVCWGGYPKPHAVAQEDAWRRLLKFLHDNLDQKQSTTSRL